MHPLRTAFAPWMVAMVMVSILMATALISPLYPLYGMAWQLSPGELTQIYVLYMVGALACLLFMGRLADRWGPRQTLLLGLGLALIGTLLSALAKGPLLFTFARFLVGIASSLATTGGAVALLAVMPPEKRGRLASMTSLSIVAGFGLGPVIGGLAGHFSETALQSVFYPALALQAVSLLMMLLILPEMPSPNMLKAKDFLPKLSWPGNGQSMRFSLTICVPFLAFGVFGLHSSLTPLMISDMTGLSGPLVTGLSLALLLIGAGLSQLFGAGLSARKAAVPGLLLMAAGAAAMLLNLKVGSVWLFGFGGICAMFGHGLSLLGSSKALYEVSDASNRGALTATYWATGYSGAVFPLLGVGWIADHWGTNLAVGLFFAVITCLALGLVLAIRLLLPRP